jgi:phosphate transport system protein
MTRYLNKELDKLKKQLLTLGTMVEERYWQAVAAINTLDIELAEKVIAADGEIDEREVEIEEEALKIIALYQPVAIDLRFIVAIIKINNDLERIADEAVNVCQRVVRVAQAIPLKVDYDYRAMSEKTGEMLKKCLDSFVNLDTDLATSVRRMDGEVDRMKNSFYDLIKAAIRKDPDRVGAFINLLLISRHLERVADHSTNIAEEVIHMVEGVIVRHGGDI